MNKPLSALLTLGIISATLLQAEEGESRKVLTQAEALKLGEEKLVDQLGTSEVDADRACRLYATAKRIETETALGRKDLEQVMELESWRSALNECADSICSAAYFINGGGTMYSHAASRNDGSIEDFLSVFSKKLPYPEGKGDADSLKKMDAVLLRLKKLEIMDDIKETSSPDDLKAFAEAKEEMIQKWETLKYMLANLPAADAKKAAEFSFTFLSWIEEEPEGDTDKTDEPKEQPGKSAAPAAPKPKSPSRKE